MRPLLFYLSAIVIILADQVSKVAVVNSIPEHVSRPIINNVLHLTHVHNTGGAFSIFRANNGVFIVVASLVALVLLFSYHRGSYKDLAMSAALSLALGGAIGNLIDRVRFGYVIDFFDIRVWPVFNVADSAITVGILLLAWQFIKKPATAPVTTDELEKVDR